MGAALAVLASGLGAALAQTAATSYDFSSYKDRFVIANVFQGNFEALKDPPQSGDISDQQLEQLRAKIVLNAFNATYHEYFGNACAKDGFSEPASEITTITLMDSPIFGESKSPPHKVRIRDRFLKGYAWSMDSLSTPIALASYGAKTPARMLEVGTQVKKFLDTVGCKSPAAKQMEENMRRASLGEPSLQKAGLMKSGAAFCSTPGILRGALHDGDTCACVAKAVNATKWAGDLEDLEKDPSRGQFLETVFADQNVAVEVQKCLR